MENFWDLHIAYVRECEKLNWANDTDPHHYGMEWHHILPQCLFGNQPIGAWLTLRQHAIASCLQSIALRKVCLCPWHHQHTPEWLWELMLEATEAERKVIARKGFDAVENFPTVGGIAVRDRSLGIFSLTEEERKERSRRAGATARDKKAGIHGGTPEERKEWSAKALSVKFRCLVTGHISNGAGLSSWQRARNIDTSLKERLE